MFSNVDADILNANKHPTLQSVIKADDLKIDMPKVDNTYNTASPNIELHSPTQKNIHQNVALQSQEQLKEDSVECTSNKEIKTNQTSNAIQSNIMGNNYADGDPLEDEDILKIDRLQLINASARY